MMGQREVQRKTYKAAKLRDGKKEIKWYKQRQVTYYSY